MTPIEVMIVLVKWKMKDCTLGEVLETVQQLEDNPGCYTSVTWVRIGLAALRKYGI